MTSTYSTSLGIELMGTGDQSGTWGVTTNTNLGTLIEQAIAGYATQAVTDSGTATVLTITDGSSSTGRNAVISLTGALTAARVVEVPAKTKTYIFANNTTGGFAVTVKVNGQTGVSIANGYKALVYCDGTDVRLVVSDAISSSVVTLTGTQTLTNKTLTAPVIDVINSTTIGATTPSTGAFTTLSASGAFTVSGTVSGTGMTTYLASPPAIGGSTAAAGSFTALSYSTTLTGGTGIVNLGSGQFYKDASGYVGINTTSPTAGFQMEVKAATGVGASVLLTATDATGNAQAVFKGSRQWQVGSGNASSGFAGVFYIYDGTAAAERYRIGTSGELGVGGANYGTSGQVLTSGGSGAAPSWTTVSSSGNAKAWVRWAGSTGTIASSFNVSSVTRNSTGNYTVNFTSALANANYAPIGMTAGAGTYGSYGVYMQQTSAPTTTSCALTTLSNSGTAVDCISAQVAMFGT